jgi:hypothetical protein
MVIQKRRRCEGLARILLSFSQIVSPQNSAAGLSYSIACDVAAFEKQRHTQYIRIGQLLNSEAKNL